MFDVEPVSVNVSVNQKAKFSCSTCMDDVQCAAVVWVFCPKLGQTQSDECELVNDLDTMDSGTIIDSEIINSVSQPLSSLVILIRDDLHLLNELNNSLISCLALAVGAQPFNSSQARLLIQGQLHTVIKQMCIIRY